MDFQLSAEVGGEGGRERDTGICCYSLQKPLATMRSAGAGGGMQFAPGTPPIAVQDILACRSPHLRLERVETPRVGGSAAKVCGGCKP